MKSRLRFFSLSTTTVLVSIVGCGSSVTLIPSVPASPASTIYLVQSTYGPNTCSILEMPANAQGSVNPTASISEPSGSYCLGVAVDHSGNVYTGIEIGLNNPVYEIAEYAPAATGMAAPIRTISTSGFPWGIAVDSEGQIYAPSAGGISVYTADASGNATPIRDIEISGLLSAFAVDNQRNLYVTAGTSIQVFSPTANGNTAPTRTITWSISQFGRAQAIAVDKNGYIYAVAAYSGSYPVAAILKFAPGANGLATPVNTLTTPRDPDHPYWITAAAGLAMDDAGNLYAQTFDWGTGFVTGTMMVNAITVDVFAPGATDGSAPAQIITSPSLNPLDWGPSIAVH